MNHSRERENNTRKEKGVRAKLQRWVTYHQTDVSEIADHSSGIHHRCLS